MLTISLHRIEFDGRHGATAVERRSTRKFEVDVELDVDAAAAERSDRLAETVDYSRVAETIVGVGMGEPHHLLESLAAEDGRRGAGALPRACAGCASSCASSTRPPARGTPPTRRCASSGGRRTAERYGQ